MNKKGRKEGESEKREKERERKKTNGEGEKRKKGSNKEKAFPFFFATQMDLVHPSSFLFVSSSLPPSLPSPTLVLFKSIGYS